MTGRSQAARIKNTNLTSFFISVSVFINDAAPSYACTLRSGLQFSNEHKTHPPLPRPAAQILLLRRLRWPEQGTRDLINVHNPGPRCIAVVGDSWSVICWNRT
ncbi:hypothetical protein P280DRAFT_474713 [Massarina eburnea CBS 473.64]|uniref:Uncharacterized protein n=1 Tax=Massarina eburnea CBS 473.64 TaxID=1395130 RepID=A0A6A6RGJ4_9PLEO|nr:hypothetical protein P280DRAFT_474713 [Massarina eburnea CBS 473.64]